MTAGFPTSPHPDTAPRPRPASRWSPSPTPTPGRSTSASRRTSRVRGWRRTPWATTNCATDQPVRRPWSLSGTERRTSWREPVRSISRSPYARSTSRISSCAGLRLLAVVDYAGEQPAGAVAGEHRRERAGVGGVVLVGLGEAGALHPLRRLGDPQLLVVGDLRQRVVERVGRVVRVLHLRRRCPSPARAAAGTGRGSRGRRGRCCGSCSPGTPWRGRSRPRGPADRGVRRWRRSGWRSRPARWRGPRCARPPSPGRTPGPAAGPSRATARRRRR